MDRYKPENNDYYILNGDICKNADVSIEMQGYKVVIIRRMISEI